MDKTHLITLLAQGLNVEETDPELLRSVEWMWSPEDPITEDQIPGIIEWLTPNFPSAAPDPEIEPDQ